MNYFNLFIMSVLSFISMYILMYAMVDSFANIYSNFNQIYMAGLMTIPMVVIELMLMRSMYTNKKLNFIILLSCGILFVLFFLFIRNQIIISDKQFLKSMIPHHAGAILMCNKAKLTDPKLKNLCDKIIKSQQEEINFMKKELENYKD